MSWQKNLKNVCIILALSAFLVACNSDSDSTNNNSPTTPMAINAQNARTIAEVFLNNQYEDFSDELNASASNSAKSLIAKSKRLQSSIQTRALSNNESIACDVSGSYLFTGDINTGIGTYTYNNCVTSYFGGYSETENGKVVVIGTGSLFESVFDGTLEYDSYTITTDNPAGFEKYEGKLSITFDFGINTLIYTYNISGQSLSMVENDDTFDLYDYLLSFEGDTTNNVNTFVSNYTLESNLLSGSLKLQTLKPVKSFWNNLSQPFPFEGMLLFTGANNSQLKLTVIEGGMGAPTDSLQIVQRRRRVPRESLVEQD